MFYMKIMRSETHLNESQLKSDFDTYLYEAIYSLYFPVGCTIALSLLMALPIAMVIMGE